MVDYSKWKDIEISDDEDDTHPNVDTGSLFRWRHEARLQKMEEQKQEKAELEKKKKDLEAKKKQIEIQQKKEVKTEVKEADSTDMSKIKVELEELKRQEEEFRKKEEELAQKEKLQPWNVDTICKESSKTVNKTVINKTPQRKKDKDISEEEKEKKYREFVQKNEKYAKQFGMLQKFDDSKKFLQEHQELACEDTANYLVWWCVNLVMEEKNDLMLHVSHQCICLQFILELAKQLEYDPRACITPFFTRIQMADQVYKEGFDEELRGFRERVKARAEVKMQQLLKEVEEEEAAERKKHLKPGQLDPVEVFDSLPKEMQDCFEQRNIEMLKEVIAKMPEEEAKYHMKRCIDSGMWVPDANKAQQEGGEAAEASPDVPSTE